MLVHVDRLVIGGCATTINQDTLPFRYIRSSIDWNGGNNKLMGFGDWNDLQSLQEIKDSVFFDSTRIQFTFGTSVRRSIIRTWSLSLITLDVRDDASSYLVGARPTDWLWRSRRSDGYVLTWSASSRSSQVHQWSSLNLFLPMSYCHVDLCVDWKPLSYRRKTMRDVCIALERTNEWISTESFPLG